MERILEHTRYIGSGNSAWKLWRRTPRIVSMTLLYFLLILFLFPNMSSAQAVTPLLIPLPQEIRDSLDEQALKAKKRSAVRDNTVKTVTHMGIDNAFFQQPLVTLPAGTPAFEFNLPGITPVSFEVESVREEKDGRIIMTGVAANFGTKPDPTAFLIVDTSNNSIIGEIRIGKMLYEILPAGQGAHSIWTFYGNSFPREHGPTKKGAKPVSKSIDDGPPNAVPVRFPSTARQDHVMWKGAVVTLVAHGSDPMPIIDVMVLFTPDAKRAFTPNNILDVIEKARKRMSDSFIRQGIHAIVNVVSIRCYGSEGVVDYESGNLEDLVRQLQWDPIVRSWREADGADLVFLWVNNGGAYCGMSINLGMNQIPIEEKRRDDAFSIIDAGCVLHNESFAHELGHQLGLNHDRVAAEANGDIYWNYGFITPDFGEKDIMAEDPSGCEPHCPTIVNAWSDGRTRGMPKGASVDGDTKNGPADNVDALNQNIPVAEKFMPTRLTRTAICSSCPCPPPRPITD